MYAFQYSRYIAKMREQKNYSVIHTVSIAQVELKKDGFTPDRASMPATNVCGTGLAIPASVVVMGVKKSDGATNANLFSSTPTATRLTRPNVDPHHHPECTGMAATMVDDFFLSVKADLCVNIVTVSFTGVLAFIVAI
jgi:hypothetical protein